MKLLLLLLFIPCLAIGQDAFKPGYYEKGAVVIDANGVKWQARANVNAKTSPKPGSYWAVVKAPEVDYAKEIAKMQAEISGVMDAFDSMKVWRDSLATELAKVFTLKVSNNGYSIINLKGDKTGARIRALVPGKGFKINQTDSTLTISAE